MIDGNPYRVRGAKLKRRVKMVAVTREEMELVNKSTGEVRSVKPYIGNSGYRDITCFVKLYDVESVLGLDGKEMKLFIYIMSIIDFSGMFYLDGKTVMKKLGMCKSSFYSAYNGLLSREFIKKDKGVMWINPNIAFKGKREELIDLYGE